MSILHEKPLFATETHKICYSYDEKCAATSFINLFKPQSGCAVTVDAGLTKLSETHNTFQCGVGLKEEEKNRTYLINLCKLRADALELLRDMHTQSDDVNVERER